MIIKLTDLKNIPCQEYLDLFFNGEIDVYEAFKKQGEQWGWLFNNVLDKNIIISQFDADKFNWEEYSYYVAEYYQELFDADKYNWECDSRAVAKYCPEHFDAEKYNWEEGSDFVAKYCPEHFDADKFNWEEGSEFVAKYCPEHFDPDKFNWDHHSDFVARYCPEFLHLNPKTNKTLERGLK